LKYKLTFKSRNLIVLTLLAIGLPAAARAQDGGTVFQVRHAEKLSMARDAVLSPQGHKRADCLARILGDAGIQVIFATGLMPHPGDGETSGQKAGNKGDHGGI
jgi:hypothetical protein